MFVTAGSEHRERDPQSRRQRYRRNVARANVPHATEFRLGGRNDDTLTTRANIPLATGFRLGGRNDDTLTTRANVPYATGFRLGGRNDTTI
jgi:hypothetical protein